MISKSACAKYAEMCRLRSSTDANEPLLWTILAEICDQAAMAEREAYDVRCDACGKILSVLDALPEEGGKWVCRPCA